MNRKGPHDSTYIVGLDLGQTQDYTALAVLEKPPRTTAKQKREDTAYLVRHLQRFDLGTPYTEIVAKVTALFSKPPLQGSTLLVDQTGVGRAVVDLFRSAQPKAMLRPVTITSGHAESLEDDGCYHVPKRELVSVLQVLLQTRRLKIANTLAESAVLVKEMQTFQVKITAAANETFGTWREGDHDDLVLAAALACWWAEGTGWDPGMQLVQVAKRDQRDHRDSQSLFARMMQRC